MSRVTAIRTRLINSPAWRTIFASVIPLLVGVLSGTFVVEITTVSGLEWASFYRTKSFYCLAAATIVTYLYNRATYLHDSSVDRFQDDDYCRAYMRSQCLPEAAERYKALIREGRTGTLVAAMREFERILR